MRHEISLPLGIMGEKGMKGARGERGPQGIMVKGQKGGKGQSVRIPCFTHPQYIHMVYLEPRGTRRYTACWWHG